MGFRYENLDIYILNFVWIDQKIYFLFFCLLKAGACERNAGPKLVQKTQATKGKPLTVNDLERGALNRRQETGVQRGAIKNYGSLFQLSSTTVIEFSRRTLM